MLTLPATVLVETVLLVTVMVSAVPEPTMPPTYFPPESVHFAQLERTVAFVSPTIPPT